MPTRLAVRVTATNLSQLEKGERMRPMPELEVVKVPTADLLEYQNNAKEHPLLQVDQIAASIEQFGFNNPILAWHNDDGEPEIVAGHGRLMAARKLGLQELPVVFLDHMSEEQRRAYILVDNQLTMNSGFDIEILQSELAGIHDIDMEQFDFADAFDLEFEDFDGDGDGGGSRMGSGSGCRVVIGPHIADIKEDGDECYQRASALDPDVMVRFIHDALMSGELS